MERERALPDGWATGRRARARAARWPATLYLINFSLLVAHEIDSAYWREWRLFHLPGGVQLFVALHVALVALLVHGYQRVVVGEPSGRAFSLLLAAAGIFAFAIHLLFIALGHEEFRLPVSVAVLIATLAVSLAQGALALRSPLRVAAEPKSAAATRRPGLA